MQIVFCKIAIIITVALFWVSPLQAATYTVTSAQCSGPGSIVEAIDQANLNPGLDTIEFASGLQVSNINTDSCGLAKDLFPAEYFLGTVTEDLTIIGNGAQLTGTPFWVTDDGASNIPGNCPADEDVAGTIVREAPGFLRVAPGVSVIVNDLIALDLSAYIRLDEGSEVELNNVEARRINDWYKDCKRQAIEVPIGVANLSITDSYFEQVQNSQGVFGSPDGTVFRGSNVVSGTGNLTDSGTRFEDARSAIQWCGNADIVTSQFQDTGWINAYGPGTTNIVNSVFQGSTKNSSDLNSVRASGDAIVNIKASSLSLLDSECPAACASGFGALVATTGGAINLAESALGVGLPAALPGGSYGMILRTAGGTITADFNSWIQPTQIQPADDLKAITGQPLLLTDVPGLPTIADGALFFFPFPNALTPLLGTADNPGVLIDVIADAGAGGANELISPIDGFPITADALGNDRVDGNGKRNIGAVQLTLAPHLVVAAVGDGAVDLSWSRPLDPDSGAITGYDLCYGSGSPPDPSQPTCIGTSVAVSGPDTLSTQVTSLTNGTTYWFQVRGVNPAAGPWSNQVNGIPASIPDAPVVSAIPATRSVQLSWTSPNDQGSALTGYVVQYRPAGTTTWQQTSFTGLSTNFTVGGLTYLTSYEFSVIAINGIGSSNRGQVTANTKSFPWHLFTVPITSGGLQK